jgi:hypothetical protein
MSNTEKEFHLHITTNSENKQAFLFTIKRNEQNKTIELCDIHIITQFNGIENKTTLKMKELTHLMGMHRGGNVLPEGLNELREVFHDSMNTEDQDHLNQLINMFELKQLNLAEQLIVAGEIALNSHPVNQSIEEIVNDKLNGNKS